MNCKEIIIGGTVKDYNNELKDQQFLRLKPREGTEAKKVLEEVEKRKKIAKEKGLDRLITHIYFQYLDYSFRWTSESIKNYFKESYQNVLDLLKEVNEVESLTPKDSNEKTKSINLLLNNKQYRFNFKKEEIYWCNEYYVHGHLELFEVNKRLFALDLSDDYKYGSSDWRPFSIVAFIEGDWINDFESLKEAILLDNQNKAIREAEDHSKTEFLKKNFGIE